MKTSGSISLPGYAFIDSAQRKVNIVLPAGFIGLIVGWGNELDAEATLVSTVRCVGMRCHFLDRAVNHDVPDSVVGRTTGGRGHVRTCHHAGGVDSSCYELELCLGRSGDLGCRFEGQYNRFELQTN